MSDIDKIKRQIADSERDAADARKPLLEKLAAAEEAERVAKAEAEAAEKAGRRAKACELATRLIATSREADSAFQAAAEALYRRREIAAELKATYPEAFSTNHPWHRAPVTGAMITAGLDNFAAINREPSRIALAVADSGAIASLLPEPVKPARKRFGLFKREAA